MWVWRPMTLLFIRDHENIGSSCYRCSNLIVAYISDTSVSFILFLFSDINGLHLLQHTSFGLSMDWYACKLILISDNSMFLSKKTQKFNTGIYDEFFLQTLPVFLPVYTNVTKKEVELCVIEFSLTVPRL